MLLAGSFATFPSFAFLVLKGQLTHLVKFSACTLWIYFSSDFEFILALVLSFGSVADHLIIVKPQCCSYSHLMSDVSRNRKRGIKKLKAWSLSSHRSPHLVSTEFES